MADTVIRGTAATAQAYFYIDGTSDPLQVIGGVTYQIFTPENVLVLSGVATQDMASPARWTINFVIPNSAPTTAPDQRYLLKWRARSGNEIVSINEYFAVTDPAGNDVVDTTVVALVGQPFRANLLLPESDIASLSLRVLTTEGNPVISLGNLITDPPEDASPPGPITPTQAGSNYVYSVNVDNVNWLAGLTIRNSGLATYFAYFNYTTAAGEQKTEIQPIYLANTILISIMNDMRQFVDMLRNADVVAELRVSEAKLLHFATQGLLRLNAASPANFTFDFISIPQQFYFYVVKAAQYELLSAMYLAEGMTSFDFQGMSVQLNMERTQYIQTLMSDIRSDLDNNMPKAKAQYARSGGFRGRVGTIGANLGPNFNFVFRAQYGYNNWGGPLPLLPFLY